MQGNNISASLYIPIPDIASAKKPAEDYSVLLEKHGAIYYKVDYYWQVGVSPKVQGWILHLSVIASQLSELLNKILPILLDLKVPFKLSNDSETARNILDGNLGSERLGKVISIYPENDQDALTLAKRLVEMTLSFRGPSIPTDIHLGGVVYTRYGAINPIIRRGANGEIEKHIYDPKGDLVKDKYSIPFKAPNEIFWPFSELSNSIVPKFKKNLKNIYKPLITLKPDARGNVTKAIYLRSLFRVSPCVIKTGKKNMLVDDMGRDIKDRLIWQRDLHNQLIDCIRLPKILDFFEENEEYHLVMEFIEGKSLNESLAEVTGSQKSWFQLSIPEQTKILGWLLKILSIIDLLHTKGFVHRDIAPGNFIIDPKDEIVLIDTELAYNLKRKDQEIPFELGTPGFMSPEQEALNIPTIKQDIYGLGALMINIFTCLSAVRFNPRNPDHLMENIFYFIQDQEISQLICACLSYAPSERPTIQNIQNIVASYKLRLEAVGKTGQKEPGSLDLSGADLSKTIDQALIGLSHKPMPISRGIWLSKTINANDNPASVQEFSPYYGIHTGMGGVLYLIATAKKAGFDTQVVKHGYKECWKYIYQECLKNLDNVNAGLNTGAAGVALALLKGLDADLLEDSELIRECIQKCLEKYTDQLNLAEGVAGQGLVLLQSESYMPKDNLKAALDNILLKLLQSQNRDGSWNTRSIQTGKQSKMTVSWFHGITGIIYFLALYNSRFENKQVEQAINRSLNYLRKLTNDLQGLFKPSIYKNILNNKPEIGDERTSIILCFIQAYNLLKISELKEMTESVLYQYPQFVVNSNFSQDGGMAALGEVYLDAWRVFGNDEWYKRACQIASVFLHTKYEVSSDSGCYWITDETSKPTADLFGGNSGIIHFLLRCSRFELGHILLG